MPRLSSSTLLEDHDRRQAQGLLPSLACMTVSQQPTLIDCAFLLALDLSGPRDAAGASTIVALNGQLASLPVMCGGNGGCRGGQMILHPSHLLRCG